jgi:hypothetical protein
MAFIFCHIFYLAATGILLKFCHFEIPGAINILGWSIWCLKFYKQRPYVKQCAAFIALVGFTTLFEVLDFPPLFWVFDAHALWHLSTAPLAILWYK